VRLSWVIAPGYHLYRERLSFNGSVGLPLLPSGVRKFDPNFNKEMETYQDGLAAQLPVTASAPFTLEVGYQGCADAGLCYAPVTQHYRWIRGGGGRQAGGA
jgi:thiol:disulfide interchange protein DsbD